MIEATVIEYNGKTKTVSQWAKEMNVPKETLRYRIRIWGIERALTTPHKKQIPPIIEFKGVIKSVKDWADYLNIGIPAFKVRIRQWGLCDKTFQVRGVTHNNQTKTLAAWSRELKTSINHRVARNMHPEKVFISTKYKTRSSLLGLRFNRLVVVEESGRQCGKRMWLCLCDCGNTKLVQTGNLIQNRVQSCGCIKKYAAAVKKYPHLRSQDS